MTSRSSEILLRATDYLGGLAAQLPEVQVALEEEFPDGPWRRAGTPVLHVELAALHLAAAQSLLYAEVNEGRYDKKETANGRMFLPMLIHYRVLTGATLTTEEKRYILLIQENPVTSDEVHAHVRAMCRELRALEGEGPLAIEPLDKLLSVAIAALWKVQVILKPEDAEPKKGALDTPARGWKQEAWDDLSIGERKEALAYEKAPSGIPQDEWDKRTMAQKKVIKEMRALLGKKD